MGYLKYKGYVGSVEYDEQDGILYGRVIGSKDQIAYRGASVAEIKSAFKNAVDRHLVNCKTRNVEPHKSYTGVLNIRISPDGHGRLADLARRHDTSINNLIRTAVSEFVKSVT